MKAPRSTSASPSAALKPSEIKAVDLLSGRMAGRRHGRSLETVEVGKITRIIRLSEKAMAYLREHGERNNGVIQQERRVSVAVKARAQALRRPNPSAARQAALDEQIVALMIRAHVVEKASAIYVMREGLARHFNVPDHTISQCFERLNKRGLLGPEVNLPAHDSTRDRWGGGDSAWIGSIRYVQDPKLKELISNRGLLGLNESNESNKPSGLNGLNEAPKPGASRRPKP